MQPRARGAGVLVALVVGACCLSAVAFAAPASPEHSPGPQVGDAPLQTGGITVAQTDDQPEPDNTITRIDLAADGSATWEITLRTRLETEDELAEYERFQDQFRENTSRYLDPFADRMTGVVAAANDSSDREMQATDFEAETAIQEVPRRWGVVSFRFTWTGFAATDGGDIVAGDVFDGGFFIGDDDVLAIAVPDGYAIAEVEPTPDDIDGGVAEWNGREDFADGRPSIRASPAGAGGGTDDGPGDGGDDGTAGGVGSAGVLAAIAAVLLALALAALASAVRSGRVVLGGDEPDDGEPRSESQSESKSGSEPGAQSESNSGAPIDGAAAAASGPAAESADLAADDRATAAGENGRGDAATAVDPDLLTDKDRVKRALRAEGGRMKQSAIVDELGWSKSKTSRVLSQMADDGDIEKLRIGRENVIDVSSEE